MRFKEWTNEELRNFTPDQLRAIAVNADSKGYKDLSDRCKAELTTRHEPARKSVRRRSSNTSNLESEMAEVLGGFIVALSKEFDLSRETAKRLSTGTKRFVAHKLTDPKGHAKTGGMQKSGDCQLDRFVSYRVGNTVISLTAYLATNKMPEEVEFHVYGPSEHFEFPQTWQELRPGTKVLPGANLYQYGQKFTDLSIAKEKMQNLVGIFAPKI